MPIEKDDLERFRVMGDAEADRDLALILRQLGEPPAHMLFAQLGKWDPSKSLDELKPPLAAYVKRPLDFPAWGDEGSIAAAQKAYTQLHRPAARVILAAYSLPILYIHPEISFTLASSGQLLQHVRRRLEDTRAFVDGVMAPESLKQNGAGQKWIRKVRLTHAMIRRMMQDLGDPARGAQSSPPGAVDDKMPLDQVEMALVLQTFAWAMVEGLGKMGWPMRHDEPGNHVHAWSVIGSMLGIHEDLLPRGADALRDAENLFVLIRDDLLSHGDPFGPIADDKNDSWMSGRLLVAAWITFLTQIQRERVPEGMRGLLTKFPRLDEALLQTPRILIRRLCGDAAARHLRIGRAGLFDQLVCMIWLIFIDLRNVADEAQATSTKRLSRALVRPDAEPRRN